MALPLNLTGNLSTSLPLTENSKEYITYTLIVSSKQKIDVAWQLPNIHIVVIWRDKSLNFISKINHYYFFFFSEDKTAHSIFRRKINKLLYQVSISDEIS